MSGFQRTTAGIFLLGAAWSAATAFAAPTITVTGQDAGPTPFIAQLHLSVTPAGTLQTVRFTISPKPGSVTRPISAIYDAVYLKSRGDADPTGGTVTVPVFGLYADYANSVTLAFDFTDGSSSQTVVTVATAPYAHPCVLDQPIVIQPRTNTTTLSYDYAILKSGGCGNISPTLVDTDGAVRWVGTANSIGLSAIFFDNAFYVSSINANSAETVVKRLEFDGTVTLTKDYSNLGITHTDHHNYDRGKDGILVEVNTTQWTESVIIEIDTAGNILRTWNLADIISAAMTAGGDDPTQFVHPAPNDWFHNNAATYWASTNSLIVSSRENFVIALDYDTGAIKWILGDTTKQWYQFPSLAAFALTLSPGSSAPIGQHAVSITADDNLLLFDNGKSSLNHSPAGADRTVSVARKYHIDTQAKLATEVWNYTNNPPLYSPFCSSIYEDQPLDYLIAYSIIQNLPGGPFAEWMGLDDAGTKIFDYQYPTAPCADFWNAAPIHLEDLRFIGTAALPTPTPTPTPTGTRVARVAVVPRKIRKTGTATFTVSLSAPASQPITVKYATAGNAVLGRDYSLSGTPNQIPIPAGQTTGQISLTAITSKTTGQERARINLVSGLGYHLSRGRSSHAAVIIRNR